MDKYPLLIGGEEIFTDNLMEVRNPYNDEVIGQVSLAGEKEALLAIRKAEEAFEQMKGLATYERVDALNNIADALESEKERLARIMTLESGKPISYTLGEMERCIFLFRTTSCVLRNFEGSFLKLDLLPFAKGKEAIVRRYPIGPVLAITPFNFPINLAAHKIAPALAVGNTVIWKPAPQTPISAIEFGRVINHVFGIKGFLNVVPAPVEIAESFVRNDRIKMLSFTGSDKVGWYLKGIASKKKIALELGGNAATIVCKDCSDLDTAVSKMVIGAYANAGQVCISVQRVFVQKEIYDKVRDMFVEKAKSVKVGDPMDKDTVVGPMIDKGAIERAVDWINKAVKAGAKLTLGGNVEGNFLYPTILENVPPGMEVSCREVFAPIVVFDSFEDIKEAVYKVNDSVYGLQAGIFTQDIDKIMYAYDNLVVGGVIVNDIPTFRIDHYPYGGVKDSGMGREGIKVTMEEMTEYRVLIINRQNV